MNFNKYTKTNFKNGRVYINFVNRGYYIENNIDLCENYFSSLEEYMRYAKEESGFINAYYNITYRCNLNCTYCYAEHNNEFVTLEDNYSIIKNLLNIGIYSITLIGGEPFAHPYFNKLFEEIVKAPFNEISIITNGTLITDEFIEKYKNDNRIYIQISIDGISEEENAITRGKENFNKAYKNIIKLKEKGILVKVMKTITKENIEKCLPFYKFYKNIGIESGFFLVKKVNATLRPTIEQMQKLMDDIYYETEESLEEVFNIIKFADNLMFGTKGYPIMHCGGGINTISISPNGDIYPCVKRTQKELVMGNILSEEGIKKYFQKRNQMLDNDLVINKALCNNCKIKFFCGGGCRAQNDYTGYEIDGFDCNYYKLAFNYYFEHIKN